MKRYAPTYDLRISEPMTETPNGDWVRYEDYAALIQLMIDLMMDEADVSCDAVQKAVDEEREACAKLTVFIAETKGNCDAHFDMADWIEDAILARGER